VALAVLIACGAAIVVTFDGGARPDTQVAEAADAAAGTGAVVTVDGKACDRLLADRFARASDGDVESCRVRWPYIAQPCPTDGTVLHVLLTSDTRWAVRAGWQALRLRDDGDVAIVRAWCAEA